MKTRIVLALSFFVSACGITPPPLPTLASTATQRLITPTRESATPIPKTVVAQVTQSAAQSPTSSSQSSIIDLYVDPAKGDDGRTGATRDLALKTVTEAWNRIPKSKMLTQGYRIRLLPGVYAPGDLPNYWEMRYGTERAPIILQGEGEVKLPPINIFDVRWFYLISVQLEGREGDVLHCEKCDHFFVQRSKIVGLGDVTKHDAPQETIKINQSQYVFIEDSDVSGAFGNAIDFVAVQHAVIQRNKIHRAGDWCAYTKGGSAYIRVEANEIYDCGTGGFTAGQGTGFE
ncbi:MAG: right-handed parallel beta-helix repeat-containing protein, partial [Chloroflexi bacterium]|nr:right-handed parallel beta-helix repeat-containing protein [Chloroflexota bacterium]